jgi:hypothetical protein
MKKSDEQPTGTSETAHLTSVSFPLEVPKTPIDTTALSALLWFASTTA